MGQVVKIISTRKQGSYRPRSTTHYYVLQVLPPTKSSLKYVITVSTRCKTSLRNITKNQAICGDMPSKHCVPTFILCGQLLSYKCVFLVLTKNVTFWSFIARELSIYIFQCIVVRGHVGHSYFGWLYDV